MVKQIDVLIQACNRTEVAECLAAIDSLTTAARADLLNEYRCRPDSRFGDSLLVALSMLDR